MELKEKGHLEKIPKLHCIQAKAVIFATGGYGRVFNITSNAFASTADGVMAAYRAGVPLEDAEFVQYHPSGLYRQGILFSEAARGEGGYLINKLWTHIYIKSGFIG